MGAPSPIIILMMYSRTEINIQIDIYVSYIPFNLKQSLVLQISFHYDINLLSSYFFFSKIFSET